VAYFNFTDTPAAGVIWANPGGMACGCSLTWEIGARRGGRGGTRDGREWRCGSGLVWRGRLVGTPGLQTERQSKWETLVKVVGKTSNAIVRDSGEIPQSKLKRRLGWSLLQPFCFAGSPAKLSGNNGIGCDGRLYF